MSDSNQDERPQEAQDEPSGQGGGPEEGARKEEASGGLGLAGYMARGFIHSPLTPLFLMASLAIGLIGLLITPRQEDPQISVPMVDIFVQYPGASSEQVSSLVARPLERMMSELTGVDHVYSGSERDRAMVTVQFKVGEEKGPSLVKVYDKLASNMDQIPPGVSEPLVKPKGVNDVPILNLTFWSDEVDDVTLHQIALESLQRINELPNINQGFVVHGREETLRIEVLPEKLAGYDITIGQIANTIRAANKEKGIGQLESGGKAFKIYTGEFLRGEDDVNSLVVGVYRGRPIYVRDVANVQMGPSETHKMVRQYTGAANERGMEANGLPAVTLAIAKKEGSNGVTVADNILHMVDTELKGRVIPDNVKVTVSRNYGESAQHKVNELIFKLFVATGVVAVLVLFFLGWRAMLVVVIVIPIVILITVFFAWLMGYTIDRVSLFALIFAIGILVDDAIVVVENIYRRWLLQGDTDTDTSVNAVSEVGNPTILATFTVIAALLPMGFVSGMMGPYMEPIPALGSVAMIFSLIAAFVFTPWLAMRLKPSMGKLHKQAEKEHREADRLERFFRSILTPLIRDRGKGWLFLIGLIVVFFLCLTLFYTKDVRVKMLPLDNKSEFQVVINFPEGTALTETASLTDKLAQELRQFDEVVSLQSYVGTASPFNFNGLVRHYYLRQEPWQGDIQVQLTHKGEREVTSHDIAVQAREVLTPIAEEAGARIQVVEMPPGPPVLQTVVAEIYGPSAEIRREVARDVMGMFERADNLADVDTLMQQPYTVYDFRIDREKASRIGVTVEDLNRSLEMAMGGYRLGDVKPSSTVDPTEIILQAPLQVRTDFSRIGQLPISARVGGTVPMSEVGGEGSKTVPLSELGEFAPIKQDPLIYHKDLRPVEFVTAEGVGRLAAPVYGMLEVEAMLEDYTPPDGGKLESHWIGPPDTNTDSAFEWAGEWTVTYETFRDMGIAFAVALLLIYMLVVWEFGNFMLPLVVMAPIPLTLVGILPGHWLLAAEFTATSMIGFIALAGIIVRNSILLVDFAKHEVDKGVAVSEAVILASKARTRPIVITALALVGGASVIITDPIFQGMAVSLMFGVVVSTLLTLLVIPLGCVSARQAFCTEGPAAEFEESPCDNDPLVPAKGKGPAKGGEAKSPETGGERGGLVGAMTSTVRSIGLSIGFLVMALLRGIAALFRPLLGGRRSGAQTRQAGAGAEASMASPAPQPAAASSAGGSGAAPSEPEGQGSEGESAQPRAQATGTAQEGEPSQSGGHKAARGKKKGRRGIRLKDELKE